MQHTGLTTPTLMTARVLDATVLDEVTAKYACRARPHQGGSVYKDDVQAIKAVIQDVRGILTFPTSKTYPKIMSSCRALRTPEKHMAANGCRTT